MKKLILNFNAKWLLVVAFAVMSAQQMSATKTYTYVMNYAGGAGAAGANVSYWYTNSTCTTSCKIENGTDNRFTSATTIYYKDATISSTAFTVTPAGDGNYATFKQNSTACYFFLGKQDATLTLPTYSGEKITNVTITRGGGGSGSATANIYSGSNAASTQLTLSTSGGTYSFNIIEQYQTTALTFKLVGNYNSSLNQIVITTESASSTVTYHANGATSGSVPTDATAYAPNATVTVKSNTGSLARTGCTFAGWNTAADGSGTNYAASGSATFNISANTTLYAKWTATVTWEVNGTTVRTDPDLVIPAAGKSVTPPSAPDPLPCGNKFMGWTTDNIGSTGLDKDVPADATRIAGLNLFTSSTTVTGATTFYAVFADYAE